MQPLRVDAWGAIPFAALLLAIAVLPIVAEKWWHSNSNKAIISLSLAALAAFYLVYLDWREGQPGLHDLAEGLIEYGEFVVLLAALYVTAGGIAIQGQFPPTPLVNVGVLAFGAVLANFIGTTGASMLLIRPFLRINRVRKHGSHLPIFFVFVVSNMGGLLTPLGDPPLFLGFLKGVSFFWTLAMWPHWLVVNGLMLTIAFVWDAIAYRRDPGKDALPPRHGSIAVGGTINIVFLVGIVAAVLLQSVLARPWPSILQIGLALLSWLCTSRSVREHNAFTWTPIIEITVLFAGIFVTMVPALALLTQHSTDLGLTHAWQYFWLTGMLSSVLDNAPTYLSLASLAAGGRDLAALAQQDAIVLQAISAGAVFMGAMTYIANGPNFMVKSMAEEMGYPMPTFFGYLLYSGPVLLPIFAITTWLFFI